MDCLVKYASTVGLDQVISTYTVYIEICIEIEKGQKSKIKEIVCQ